MIEGKDNVWPFKTARQHLEWLRTEGFIVGRGECRQCGFAWRGAVEPGGDLERLTCPKCNAHCATFVVNGDREQRDEA